MKKLLITVLLLSLTFLAFGNDISTETAYNADTEAITETLAGSVSVAGFTASAKIILGGIGTDTVTKVLTASLGYTISSALSIAVSTTDAALDASVLPIKFVTTFGPFSGFTLTGTYANPNITADEIDIGTFTIKAAYSF
jgi:hypothetical protein